MYLFRILHCTRFENFVFKLSASFYIQLAFMYNCDSVTSCPVSSTECCIHVSFLLNLSAFCELHCRKCNHLHAFYTSYINLYTLNVQICTSAK